MRAWMDYLMLMTVFLGQIAVVFLMNVLRCDVTAPTSSSMNSGRRADIHPMYKQHDPGLNRRHHLSEKQLKRNRSRRRPQKASTGWSFSPTDPILTHLRSLDSVFHRETFERAFGGSRGQESHQRAQRREPRMPKKPSFKARDARSNAIVRLVWSSNRRLPLPSSSGPVSGTFTS